MIQTSMLRIPSLIALTMILSIALMACNRNKNQPVDQPYQEPVNTAPAPMTKSVMLYKYRFNPNSLSVPAGSTVIFSNKDPEQHNINIKQLNIDKVLKPNEKFSYTFSNPGTYTVNNRLSNQPMQAHSQQKVKQPLPH